MATYQDPPQEELEYQLYEDKYPEAPILARPADIISRWLNDHVYEDARRALRVTLDSPFGPDVVYMEGEYADPVSREGLMVGGVDSDDNWGALTMTDDGRLRVDAEVTASIEVEVEIRADDGDSAGIYGYLDGDSSTPVPINVNSQGELRIIQSSNTNTTVLYNEGAFDDSGEHAVVSYTIPAGKNFSILSIEASGHSDAYYRVKINDNIIGTKRNNWCDRNIEFKYFYGLTLSPGDIISVTIEHSELTTIPFNATIYGEEE